MKKSSFFFFVLASVCCAAVSYSQDIIYDAFDSNHPKFCNSVEKKPVFNETLSGGDLIVEVVEWQGYCGNDPNRSYPLGQLIAMAKAKYKKHKHLSTTIDDKECHGTELICVRRAYLVFESYRK